MESRRQDSVTATPTEAGRRWTADDLLAVDVAPVDGVDGVLTVAPTGEIDSLTAPVLCSALLSCLTPGVTRVVLDLTAVTFLNSAGLVVVAQAHEHARARGISLTLRGGRPIVLRALTIAGFAQLITGDGCGPTGH